jgi:hypothetical protein
MPKVKLDKLFGQHTCVCHLIKHLKSLGHLYQHHESRSAIDCFLNSSSHIHHKHFKYVIWKSRWSKTPGQFYLSYQVFRPNFVTSFVVLKTFHHALILNSNKDNIYSSYFDKIFNSFEELKTAIQEYEHRHIKYNQKKISENLYSASAAVRRNIFKPLPTFEEYNHRCYSYKLCSHNPAHYKQCKDFSSSEEDETEQQTDNGSSSRGLAVVEFRSLIVR